MNPLESDEPVKRFGDTTALAGVSLTRPAGSVTTLIGPNGAGKSTLFLTAASLLAPDAGTVHVRGHAAGTPGAQRAQPVRRPAADRRQPLPPEHPATAARGGSCSGLARDCSHARTQRVPRPRLER